MLDSIWLPPTVHIWSGMLVLTATLAAVVYTAVRAWRRRDLGPAGNAILIFAQLTLMAQAVLGIKLLDQGLGPLQLFIHYLGGSGRYCSSSCTTGCPARCAPGVGCRSAWPLRPSCSP